MLSCETAQGFSESIGQPVPLNREADVKNWHLMAYNWNKFPAIGPRREAPLCVCVWGSPWPCEGPPLASITSRDFSLLIREREEFRSASIHCSVLTKLFDGERVAGGMLFSPSLLLPRFVKAKAGEFLKN